MAYKILKTPTFTKQMMKLDPSVRKQIIDYIGKIIGKLDNPKDLAKQLTGNLNGFYRYRIGNYRIVCEFIDKEITIVLVVVGHRKYIYDLIKNKISK